MFNMSVPSEEKKKKKKMVQIVGLMSTAVYTYRPIDLLSITYFLQAYDYILFVKGHHILFPKRFLPNSTYITILMHFEKTF